MKKEVDLSTEKKHDKINKKKKSKEPRNWNETNEHGKQQQEHMQPNVIKMNEIHLIGLAQITLFIPVALILASQLFIDIELAIVK